MKAIKKRKQKSLKKRSLLSWFTCYWYCYMNLFINVAFIRPITPLKNINLESVNFWSIFLLKRVFWHMHLNKNDIVWD
jgi:hypothetical protein